MECLRYEGALNSAGYGPHRRVYAEHNGPIPPGLVVDHLCSTKSCIEPSHLTLTTQSLNVRRGIFGKGSTHNGAKLQCKRGHELAGENPLIELDGGRRCRACRRARESIYRQRS